MKIRLAAALAAIIIVNLVAPAAFAGPLDAALRGFGTSGALRWTRLVRQFGGLAKVDRVGFYAANFSIISAVA